MDRLLACGDPALTGVVSVLPDENLAARRLNAVLAETEAAPGSWVPLASGA